MDPVLIGGLKSIGLLKFQGYLAEWGICTPEDLKYFDEWDYCKLGMTRLESRKLLSISAVGAGLPPLSGLRKEIAFAEAVVEAEGYAYSCLD